MILVGNQRGGAKDLAQHLLREDNDHVRVHELRGFTSGDLGSALHEAYAVSRGTKCKQFLFSLSVNPPPDKDVSTEEFEGVINRAEAELGLTGQPRAIVFHEKQGPGGTRRHAHAVWSRINVEEMKAVQLSHTKRKLVEITRQEFIERNWQMPRGLMRSEERRKNFSYAEWQQAKRANVSAEERKTAILECWAVSDSRASFAQALESRGFKLAQGRRGFVAVDRHGEPYAISRWADVKAKGVAAKLGKPEPEYPTIEQRTKEFGAEFAQRLETLRGYEDRREAVERSRAQRERAALVARQRAERATHEEAIKQRWQREAAERQARFSTGLRGLIDRVTGRYARLRDETMREAMEAMRRDRAQRDAFISAQMIERRSLDGRAHGAARVRAERRNELDYDIRQVRSEPGRVQAPHQHSPLDVETVRQSAKDAFIRARLAQEAEAKSRAHDRYRPRGPSLDI